MVLSDFSPRGSLGTKNKDMSEQPWGEVATQSSRLRGKLGIGIMEKSLTPCVFKGAKESHDQGGARGWGGGIRDRRVTRHQQSCGGRGLNAPNAPPGENQNPARTGLHGYRSSSVGAGRESSREPGSPSKSGDLPPWALAQPPAAPHHSCVSRRSDRP